MDLWRAIMEKVGWKEGDKKLPGSRDVPQDRQYGLPLCICDGVHLSGEGDRVLFEALIETIETEFPELKVESMPFAAPDQIDMEHWHQLW